MRFGIHLSVAGGPHNAALEAASLGLECLQIFAVNPRQWRQPGLADDDAARFRRLAAEAGLDPVVVHAPYLVNLASPDDALWGRSVEALAWQLGRAAELGAAAVVVHPGSRGDRDLAWGLGRTAEAVNRALDLAGEASQVWLENTAGGKGHLGGPLGQLACLLERLEGRPVGVCLDTAHAWAAGYRLDGPTWARRFLDRVEAVLGLEWVRLWHVNDSRWERGRHRDVHCHLGQGLIGGSGFDGLVNDPRLAGAAGVMETPKDSRWADRRNLAFLRRLRRRAGEA